jgi:hypothetical protein
MDPFTATSGTGTTYLYMDPFTDTSGTGTTYLYMDPFTTTLVVVNGSI